jgi:hypothetical protein
VVLDREDEMKSEREQRKRGARSQFIHHYLVSMMLARPGTIIIKHGDATIDTKSKMDVEVGMTRRK